MPRLTIAPPRLRTADNRAIKPPERGEKRVDPFYLSAAWRELRAFAMRRAGGRCEWGNCAETDGLEAHHLAEIRDDPGRALDPSNVQVLCKSHHRQLTIRNAQRRARW